VTNVPAVISIVDDDESFRRATAGLISSLGYTVAAFGSAEEFLSSGRLKDTACLISDLHMPGMSGVELHDRLASEGHAVPVIFVTAYSASKTGGRALASGALCLLDKPFSEEKLIACLKRALGSQYLT
jgi:FixJ family two-component response regulator